MGFRFANPEMFHWLWIVPAVWFAGGIFYRRARRKLAVAFGSRLTPFLTSSVAPVKRRWKLVLESLALVFFIVALARPQMGTSQEEIKSEGVELILAVDVSSSMMAEDVRPSRLEFAKRELTKLLDMMPGDKIGVVAFAGSAALLSPVTTDKSALKMFIDSLDTASVSTQGTEFRKALVEAAEAFKRGGTPEDDDPTTKVTRVILIASDGEDNEPGALEAANRLAKDGIRIFSLAFGTEKGAPIPVRDSYGNLRGYKKDAQGQTVLSQTKGTILKALAQSGQGSFYHATFGGGGVESVVEDIHKLEKAEFESQVVTNYSEKYQIFLFFGILLALVEFLIGERSPLGRIWKGRFEVAEN